MFSLRRLLGPSLLLLLLGGCDQPPLSTRIGHLGELRIGTVAGPLSCYLGPKGPAGLEYELARRFAHSLGVRPHFLVYPTRRAALQALRLGKVQLVAAARQPSRADLRGLRPSRPWHRAPLVFVQRMGKKEAKQAPAVVPADSLAAERLSDLDLPMTARPELSEEAILQGLEEGRHLRTLVNQPLFEIMQGYLPHLVAGKTLPEAAGFRWFFSAAYDTSLERAANRFLDKQRRNGTLQRLLTRYIDQVPRRDFVTLRDFWRHLRQRLPKYEALFRQAEADTGIDWRLLAAVGYQESHWNPKARSPTGVRGLMMLTRQAARRQGVTDRLDPAQSIAGGARHLRWMEERIPARIQEPDRLWLTLASYNVGYGHLEDARILTQRAGADPDRWEAVKRHLPLLSNPKFYRTLKHGKARGGEPVTYVENIRYYYHLLVWWDHQRQGLDCTDQDHRAEVLAATPR